jgi:hypothetical protein
MNHSTRILYNAYVNTYALLAHRGYRPADGHEMVEIAQFARLEKSWQEKTNNIWVVFEKGRLFIDVAFPGDVDTKLANMFCEHITAGGSRGTAKRNAHVILVVSSVGAPAAPILANLKKQPFTRLNYKESPRIEIFTVLEMQINPLLHSRQPPVIEMIIDEDEKEEIRSRLVAAAGARDEALENIMPIMYLENPLATWYDAFVNDLFYFVRHDGMPYFRIVRPDPKIEVGAKKDVL